MFNMEHIGKSLLITLNIEYYLSYKYNTDWSVYLYSKKNQIKWLIIFFACRRCVSSFCKEPIDVAPSINKKIVSVIVSAV